MKIMMEFPKAKGEDQMAMSEAERKQVGFEWL
jgi:hypothetical protein